MAGEREASAARLLEQHLRLLLSQFEAKTKGFRTVFGWLLAFATFFLFLVLFPYLSIQYELQSIPGEIETLQGNIAGRQTQIDAYRTSGDGFERLREEVRAGPKKLREFLIALFQQPATGTDREAETEGEASSREMAQAPVRQAMGLQSPQAPNAAAQMGPRPAADAPCAGLAGDAAITCRVSTFVRAEFAEYRRILEAEVLAPLRTADGAGAELLQSDALTEELSKLETDFEERLAERPTFWRTIEGKEGFFVELEQDMEGFWRIYAETVDAQAAALRREVAVLAAAETKMKAKAGELETLKQEFKNRLDKVETPFGQLPVGLNEALLAFPVLLAIGFLVSAIQLAEAVRLRAAFHALYQAQDASRSILSDRQIALVAPLWLDPANPEQRKALNAALLAVPVVVFGLAVAVVAYAWAHTDAFRAVGSVNLGIFAGLYGLSGLAFLFGAVRLRAALAAYPTRLAGTAIPL